MHDAQQCASDLALSRAADDTHYRTKIETSVSISRRGLGSEFGFRENCNVEPITYAATERTKILANHFSFGDR
jgi:hypothetical protein